VARPSRDAPSPRGNNLPVPACIGACATSGHPPSSTRRAYSSSCLERLPRCCSSSRARVRRRPCCWRFVRGRRPEPISAPSTSSRTTSTRRFVTRDSRRSYGTRFGAHLAGSTIAVRHDRETSRALPEPTRERGDVAAATTLKEPGHDTKRYSLERLASRSRWASWSSCRVVCSATLGGSTSSPVSKRAGGAVSGGE
jgi:hypothetical protein